MTVGSLDKLPDPRPVNYMAWGAGIVTLWRLCTHRGPAELGLIVVLTIGSSYAMGLTIIIIIVIIIIF